MASCSIAAAVVVAEVGEIPQKEVVAKGRPAASSPASLWRRSLLHLVVLVVAVVVLVICAGQMARAPT